LTSFIALYRGESVATAKLIAVSSEEGIVAKFLDELAGLAEQDDEPEFRRPLSAVRGDEGKR
jgi:hypothetical protein